MSSLATQIRLILRRNYLIKRRNKGDLAMEVFYPLFFFGVLVFLKMVSPGPTTTRETRAIGDPDMLPSLEQAAGGSLIYAPNTSSDVERVMNMIRGEFSEKVLGFETQAALDDYYIRHNDIAAQDSVWGGILFENLEGDRFRSTISYSLRMNGSELPDTSSSDITAGSYEESGFLSLQLALDNAILGTVFNISGGGNSPAIQLRQRSFPKRSGLDPGISTTLLSMESVYFVAGYLPVMVKLLHYVVQEKEKKLREGMKMMGLNGVALTLGWYVTYTIVTAVPVTVATLVMASTHFLDHTSAVYPFILLALLTQSLIMLGFFISTLFDKAQTAGQFAGFLSLFLILPQFLLGSTRSRALLRAVSLLSPIAFMRGWQAIAEAENVGMGIGMGGGNLSMRGGPNTVMPYSEAVLMLILDIAFYTMGALYFDNVFPGTYGNKKGYCFCLSWLIPSRCRNRSALQTASYQPLLPYSAGSASSASATVGPGELNSSGKSGLNDRREHGNGGPLPPGVEDAVEPVPLSVGPEVMAIRKLTKVYDSTTIGVLSRLRFTSHRISKRARKFCCARKRNSIHLGPRSDGDELSEDDRDSEMEEREEREKEGGVVAVRDVSLSLYQNQILALLGHNGGGKSTMIGMLTGLFPPTAGTVHVDLNLNADSNSNHDDENPRIINGHGGGGGGGGGVHGDLVENMAGLRKHMGVCPQHDILFDQCTVREHLLFFGELKGLTHTQASVAADEKIRELELVEVTDKLAVFLSGGQKRKLSLAIALIGDPPILYCDEPTSGLDPCSRRAVWSLLQRYKKGRVIILTTHYMDEADLLGDRIAILSKGTLRCVGSSLFLKQRFGLGYHLDFTLRAPTQVGGVEDLVHEYVSDALLKPNLAPISPSFILPLHQVSKFGGLFRAIEGAPHDLGVMHYGVSLTTLEEVFLNLAHENNDGDKNKSNGRHASSSRAPVIGLAQSSSAASDEADGGEMMGYGGGGGGEREAEGGGKWVVEKRQFWGLLKKRYLVGTRNKKSVLFQCIVTLISLTIILIVLRTINLGGDPVVSPPPISASLSQRSYQGCVVGLSGVSTSAQTDTAYMLDAVPSVGIIPQVTQTSSLYDFDSYLLDPTTSACGGLYTYATPPLSPHSSSSSSSASSMLDVAIMANLSSVMPSTSTMFMSTALPVRAFPHLTPGLVNALTNARLLASTPKTNPNNAKGENDNGSDSTSSSTTTTTSSPSPSVQTTIWPFPYKTSILISPMAIILSIYMGLCFGLMPLPFAVNLVTEKESGTMQLQWIMGARPAPMWLANFIFDWFTFLLVALGSFFLFGVFSQYAFLGTRLFAAFLLFILYGNACIAMGYTVSFLFKKAITLQAFFPMIIYLVFMILYAIGIGLYSQGVQTTLPYFILALCLPQFAFTWSVFILALERAAEETCAATVNCNSESNPMHLLQWSVLGYLLFALFLQTVGYSLVTWRLHTRDRTRSGRSDGGACGVKRIPSITEHVGGRQHEAAQALANTNNNNNNSNNNNSNLNLNSNLNSPPSSPSGIALRRVPPNGNNANPAVEYVDDDDVAAERQRVDAMLVRRAGGGGGNNGVMAPIAMNDLCKNFETMSGWGNNLKVTIKHAVDRLSVAIPPGEVFGLLGPNGAGKTTAIKMLTRECGATSGNGWLANISVASGEVPEGVGCCPQSNPLIDQMTGRELLEMFGALKGLHPIQAKRHLQHLLNNLLLTEHQDKLSFAYSGGSKRKLCVALAILGQPKLIIMDEPTTGMDPEARRGVWTVISNAVRTSPPPASEGGESEHGAVDSDRRIVAVAGQEHAAPACLFTTHSMEEADALCARVGIMVNGVLKCIGPSQHLKSKFGSGYQMELRFRTTSPNSNAPAIESLGNNNNGDGKDSEDVVGQTISLGSGGKDVNESIDNTPRVKQFVADLLGPEVAPDLKLVEEFSGLLRYTFPCSPSKVHGNDGEISESGSRVLLSTLFEGLERARQTHHVLDYSLAQTTLDQVFVSFARHQIDSPDASDGRS